MYKWLLWDSELGWRIIMRCFSEWRTIPDKQRKIYLARLGFEPTTFGLLVRCSTNWATGQVGSWSSNDGIWAIWYFETDSSFLLSRYACLSACPVWFVTRRNTSLLYMCNILRYVIARILCHMCNLHIKETEISEKRSKGIKKLKDNLLCYFKCSFK